MEKSKNINDVLREREEAQKPKLKEFREKNSKNKAWVLLTMIFNHCRKKFLYFILGGNLKKSYLRRNFLDKLLIIYLLKEFKLYKGFHLDPVSPIFNEDDLCIIPIDSEVYPTILALNKLGIQTTFSCQGGQEKGHSFSAYIMARNDFPENYLSLLKEKGISFNLNNKNGDNAIHVEVPEEYRNSKLLTIEEFYNAMNRENQRFIEVSNEWAMKQGVDLQNIKFRNLKRLLA